MGKIMALLRKGKKPKGGTFLAVGPPFGSEHLGSTYGPSHRQNVPLSTIGANDDTEWPYDSQAKTPGKGADRV